jgi:hypothetical protein
MKTETNPLAANGHELPDDDREVRPRALPMAINPLTDDPRFWLGAIAIIADIADEIGAANAIQKIQKLTKDMRHTFERQKLDALHLERWKTLQSNQNQNQNKNP